MSSAAPGELSVADIIRRIESGAFPRDFVDAVARGFLPLPQEDLIPILSYLAITREQATADAARLSLAELPISAVRAFAEKTGAEPEYLDYLARATSDPGILESLVRNRTTTDETVAELAKRAEPSLQEVIVINQIRILRAPEILDALLANPQLTNDARRRVMETREDFFDKKARAEVAAALAAEELAAEEAAAAAAAAEQESLDEIADLLAKAKLEADGGEQTLPELALTEKEDPEKMTVFTRILKMTVGQKVQLAFKGSKTERGILIRDRNKLVCSAVIRNPRVSDNEIEQIAGMRNVDDEVLRLISMKRDWMAKYPIVVQLARNPKTPIGVVLTVINRLTLRDLKSLMTDKNVGEVVRTMSRKLFTVRNAKSGT